MLDPYARWGDRTFWRGFVRAAGWKSAYEAPGDDEYFQIIARLDDNTEIADFQDHEKLHIPAVYKQKPPRTGLKARHFTARIHISDRDWLLKNECKLRWELAIPLRDAERVARATAHGLGGQGTDTKGFSPPNKFVDALKEVGSGGHPEGLGDTVAVIDFGCPFLNPRFASIDKTGKATKTRIAAIWDQGSDLPRAGQDPERKAWPWQRPAAFEHGRELGPQALEAMHAAINGGAAGSVIDETAAYRGIDYLIAYDDPRRRVWLATHGAHVLDVAGGTFDPLTLKTGDAASEAALVFVQLPALTAADSAGGSLSAHLLDGLRYVLDICRPDSRVVVNISYGTFAGPHDGSSLIESAMDELMKERGENFAIVLAAGNARQAECHISRDLQTGRSALMRFALTPGDTTDTFAEVWYPPCDEGLVQVRVRSPDREWSAWVADDQEALLRDEATGDVVAMLRHDRKVPNGKQALILLAMAPTAVPDGVSASLATPGIWDIEVRMNPELSGAQAFDNTKTVPLNGWLERDDPGDGDGAQSHWIGLNGNDDQNTLNSIATGKYTVAVGGFRLSDSAPASYSSLGPQRGPGAGLPLVYGACEEDTVQRGIAAAAVRSSEVFRMNGTSVAAPVVARRLFNWLVGGSVMKAETEPERKPRTVRFDGWRDVLKKVVDHENEADDQGRPMRAGAMKMPAG